MPEIRTNISPIADGEPIPNTGQDFARFVFNGEVDLFLALGTDNLDPFQRGLHIEREADEWVIRVYAPAEEEPIQEIRLSATDTATSELDHG